MSELDLLKKVAQKSKQYADTKSDVSIGLRIKGYNHYTCDVSTLEKIIKSNAKPYAYFYENDGARNYDYIQLESSSISYREDEDECDSYSYCFEDDNSKICVNFDYYADSDSRNKSVVTVTESSPKKNSDDIAEIKNKKAYVLKVWYDEDEGKYDFSNNDFTKACNAESCVLKVDSGDEDINIDYYNLINQSSTDSCSVLTFSNGEYDYILKVDDGEKEITMANSNLKKDVEKYGLKIRNYGTTIRSSMYIDLSNVQLNGYTNIRYIFTTDNDFNASDITYSTNNILFVGDDVASGTFIAQPNTKYMLEIQDDLTKFLIFVLNITK